MIAGAVASVAAAGYYIYSSHKASATKSPSLNILASTVPVEMSGVSAAPNYSGNYQTQAPNYLNYNLGPSHDVSKIVPIPRSAAHTVVEKSSTMVHAVAATHTTASHPVASVPVTHVTHATHAAVKPVASVPHNVYSLPVSRYESSFSPFAFGRMPVLR